MRLLELEITDVRGIRNLLLQPNGKNMVIWGPNGSGKSAVVDAVDFLLTGRISRLMGTGTGNLSLIKHGPHISSKPENAFVRALIKIPTFEDPVEIKRNMAKPNSLICDVKTKEALEPVISLAKRGQHVLTRREILRFITAEGSTRAQDIQGLLNLTDIEETRKSIVKVLNEFGKQYFAAHSSFVSAKGQVSATLGIVNFNVEDLLGSINSCRAIFGAAPLKQIDSKNLKSGVNLPTAVLSDQSINVTLIEQYISSLRNVLSDESQKEVASTDTNIRALLGKLRSDPKLLKDFSKYELILLGIKLLDDSGNCPLCDKPWQPGSLRNYLEEKSSKAQMVSAYQIQGTDSSSRLIAQIESILESIRLIFPAALAAKAHEELAILRQWQINLGRLSKSLKSLFDEYPVSEYSPEMVQKLMAPDDLKKTLDNLAKKVKLKFPESTPEQTAWDMLTRLEENIKVLESAQKNAQNTFLSNERAKAISHEFEKSRDTVLQNLYDEICNRFIELYRQLHGSDEQKFTAEIKPEGAALNLEVDFYGKGVFPPHALHSEGHQDSMGICLYLALAERLTCGIINLTIFDDVVMSVDADHRRQMCSLLLKAFPDRQFLITTHDRNWATQLRMENVVESKQSIEFYNWNIDTGPEVNFESDFWERIESDLKKDDVPSASAKLRKASEQFFGIVCDSLQAQVKYKLDGRWELGDLMPPAMSQYKKLLKKAKNAACSWTNKELVERIAEVETTVDQIYSRTNAEKWAINPSVHYNNWCDLGKNEFAPVIDTFKDLFEIFRCNQCGSIIHVSEVKGVSESLKCNCGNVNLNLVEKEK